MFGIKDCITIYARKRGIPISKAETEFKTALDVICDSCVKDGGVSFKGLFSIKRVTSKPRSGVINGKEWTSNKKYRLSFKVGNLLNDKLNS